MSRTHEAGPREAVVRFARVAAAAAICWTPALAAAQAVSVATAVAGTSVRDAACASNDQFSYGGVAAEARGEWPLVEFAASGIAASTAAGKRLAASRVQGALFSPTWHGWRAEASTSRNADEAQCFSALPLSRDEVRVTRGGGMGGLWLGYSIARGAWFDTLRLNPGGPDTGRSRYPVGASRSLSAGVWRTIGTILLSASVGSRSQTAVSTSSILTGGPSLDSVWSDSAGRFVPAPITPHYEQRISRSDERVLDSELRLSWVRGRASLDVRAGSVLLRPAGLASPHWGSASLSIALTPQVALVGELASHSAAATQQSLAHRRGMLGLRFSSAPFSFGAPTGGSPARAAASEFRVLPADGGNVVVSVRAPHARVVELAGDFLAWRAVRLMRASTEWWEIRLPVPPGTHRVNLRLDGASWIAPPGVPTVKDEFGGEVGVIVVP